MHDIYKNIKEYSLNKKNSKKTIVPDDMIPDMLGSNKT